MDLQSFARHPLAIVVLSGVSALGSQFIKDQIVTSSTATQTEMRLSAVEKHGDKLEQRMDGIEDRYISNKQFDEFQAALWRELAVIQKKLDR